jgi:hypothetical protein
MTLIGFALCVFIFERTVVSGLKFLTKPKDAGNAEFSPAIGRRGFILSAIGIAVAGGGVAVAKKLWGVATFSYDGTQYKGSIV